ncbi:RRP12-like protein, partial [Tanacetum coccineum]
SPVTITISIIKPPSISTAAAAPPHQNPISTATTAQRHYLISHHLLLQINQDGADCMEAALVALGPETFLKFLPLNVEDLKSAKHEQEGRIHLARSIDGFVYSIWSLLPSFCNFSLDTDESFKDFEKALCRALQVDLQGVICSSLQNLIRQNKQVIEGENEPATLQKLQLVILRSSAREILPTLSGIFIKSSKYDDGGSLQRTIGEFAFIADKSVVSRFSKRQWRSY